VCSPLESEDGAPDVEPDALAGASLHHGCFFLPPPETRARRFGEASWG
jgi:hypothetical protein